MREFYLLNSIELFFDKHFAYAQPVEQLVGGRTGQMCPVCGTPVGSLEWLEPRKVKFSKPKYGEFVYGIDLLVSERFKMLYESSGLKGIQSFLPVEVVKAKVAHLRGKPLPDTQYYVLTLVRSNTRLDLKRSKVSGQKRERRCTLCAPFGSTIDEIDGLYIDDSSWEGESIFHIYAMGDNIFISQEFVDFCLEHKFTNFKCINTKDKQRILARLFEPLDRSKIVGNPPY